MLSRQGGWNEGIIADIWREVYQLFDTAVVEGHCCCCSAACELINHRIRSISPYSTSQYY